MANTKKANVTRIVLSHPIDHDGFEYGRGIWDVPTPLAEKWTKDASHACAIYVEPPIQEGPQVQQMPQDEQP